MRATLFLAAAVAACGALPSAAMRYAGRVEPENIGGVACGSGAPATLVARDGQFSFTPTDGVLTLTGTIAADGALRGQLVTVGADRKPFVMVVEGRLAGNRMSGTYTTPRCRFRVALEGR